MRHANGELTAGDRRQSSACQRDGGSVPLARPRIKPVLAQHPCAIRSKSDAMAPSHAQYELARLSPAWPLPQSAASQRYTGIAAPRAATLAAATELRNRSIARLSLVILTPFF